MDLSLLSQALNGRKGIKGKAGITQPLSISHITCIQWHFRWDGGSLSVYVNFRDIPSFVPEFHSNLEPPLTFQGGHLAQIAARSGGGGNVPFPPIESASRKRLRAALLWQILR